MAKKSRKKVFLPRWQRFYVLPLLILVWMFGTYQEFFAETGEKMGTAGFLFFTSILIGSAVMVFLMTTGKLPAYIIEEETTE